MVRKTCIILLLASLLLPLLPAPCAAAEYTITAAELTQLERNLTQLKAINQQSQQESATLKEQLAMLKKQLATLKAQLSTLKADSEKQKQLLQTANESLNKYAREEKAKQSRLKMQRNIAYTLAAGFLLYAAAK